MSNPDDLTERYDDDQRGDTEEAVLDVTGERPMSFEEWRTLADDVALIAYGIRNARWILLGICGLSVGTGSVIAVIGRLL